MSAPIPNQSYLVKQIENKMAACLAALISRPWGSQRVASKRVEQCRILIHTPVHWRKDSQVFSAILYPGHGSNHPEIQFSNVRLPPGSGFHRIRPEARCSEGAGERRRKVEDCREQN